MLHSAASSVKLKKGSCVVAIDFGTHATGFAYSVDGGATIKQHQVYPDLPSPYPKTLTAILYRNRQASTCSTAPHPMLTDPPLFPRRTPVSFGWTARKEFLSRPTVSEDPAATDPAAADVFRLATGFKLLLHNPNDSSAALLPPGVNAVQVGDGEPSPCFAAGPNGLSLPSALQAIADYLTLFRRYTMDALRQELGPGSSHIIAPGSITWVITVPAMWCVYESSGP